MDTHLKGSPDGLSDPKINIDKASSSAGLGQISSSSYNALSGINMNGGAPYLPPNEDGESLVFFTRPDMNLSYDNVESIRKLQFLLDGDDVSMGTAIKTMLSRINRIQYGQENKSTRSPYMEESSKVPNENVLEDNVQGPTAKRANVRSSIVDEGSPFITVLTNTLLSISGYPDHVADTFTSTAGWAKEEISWIDSRAGNYQVFDLTANFANMEGDPITSLFMAWVEYAERISEGRMRPWSDNLVDNRIDYMTRTFNLVPDVTGTRLMHIAATFGGFPTTDASGEIFNKSGDRGEGRTQISVNFRTIGIEYDDLILVDEFNTIVRFHNMLMYDIETGQGGSNNIANVKRKYVRMLTNAEKILFSNKCSPTPYLLATDEGIMITWWVTHIAYNNLMLEINPNHVIDDSATELDEDSLILIEEGLRTEEKKLSEQRLNAYEKTIAAEKAAASAELAEKYSNEGDLFVGGTPEYNVPRPILARARGGQSSRLTSAQKEDNARLTKLWEDDRDTWLNKLTLDQRTAYYKANNINT